MDRFFTQTKSGCDDVPVVEYFTIITECSCDTKAVRLYKKNGSGRGSGRSMKHMSTVIWERSIGCIHVIVRLVVEFRLKLTARVVLSSADVFDGDIGAVVRSK